MSVQHEICNHLKVSKSSSFYEFPSGYLCFGHLLFRAFPATANLEAQPQELYLGVACLREKAGGMPEGAIRSSWGVLIFPIFPYEMGKQRATN